MYWASYLCTERWDLVWDVCWVSSAPFTPVHTKPTAVPPTVCVCDHEKVTDESAPLQTHWQAHLPVSLVSHCIHSEWEWELQAAYAWTNYTLRSRNLVIQPIYTTNYTLRSRNLVKPKTRTNYGNQLLQWQIPNLLNDEHELFDIMGHCPTLSAFRKKSKRYFLRN